MRVDVDDLRPLAVRLAGVAGRRLDDAQPWVDGVLPGGVRLHAVLPPARRRRAAPEPAVRAAPTRWGRRPGPARCRRPPRWPRLLREVVAARVSLVVTGGTGAGKTTVLAALVAECPAHERVVVVEDVRELDPEHPHVVRLQGRGANVEGVGGVTLVDLVRQALRMRPDRLVVGEVRGAEVRELLAALNTGHEGGMSTVHANGPEEVPARFEALGRPGGDAAGGRPRPAARGGAGRRPRRARRSGCGRSSGVGGRRARPGGAGLGAGRPRRRQRRPRAVWWPVRGATVSSQLVPAAARRVPLGAAVTVAAALRGARPACVWPGLGGGRVVSAAGADGILRSTTPDPRTVRRWARRASRLVGSTLAVGTATLGRGVRRRRRPSAWMPGSTCPPRPWRPRARRVSWTGRPGCRRCSSTSVAEGRGVATLLEAGADLSGDERRDLGLLVAAWRLAEEAGATASAVTAAAAASIRGRRAAGTGRTSSSPGPGRPCGCSPRCRSPGPSPARSSGWPRSALRLGGVAGARRSPELALTVAGWWWARRLLRRACRPGRTDGRTR